MVFIFLTTYFTYLDNGATPFTVRDSDSLGNENFHSFVNYVQSALENHKWLFADLEINKNGGLIPHLSKCNALPF